MKDGNMETTNNTDDPLATADRLDALGAHERREPGSDFESRIARATRPGVLAEVPAGRVRGWSPARWIALPAAAAIVIGVAGLWMKWSSPGSRTDAALRLVWDEHDVDDFLFVDGLGDPSVIEQDDGTEPTDDRPADELLYEVLEGGSS